MRKAAVFLVWGKQVYIADILRKVKASSDLLRGCDIYILTDLILADECVLNAGLTVFIKTVAFTLPHLLRKTEILNFLPEGYDAYLYLDADTLVVGDITLGFEAAATHGIAIAAAPHYSLDAFCDFGRIMALEGLALHGQLQFNTGVIFFNPLLDHVQTVFSRWNKLAIKYKLSYLPNDQPFFTLACLLTEFNCFNLSPSYNYRGTGDCISGIIRIWHSHYDPPADLNQYPNIFRRRVFKGDHSVNYTHRLCKYPQQ